MASWQLARSSSSTVSQGRIIVVLLLAKYAIPHQIKPRILKLLLEEVSVGKLCFGCSSYCGRSRRMQGSPSRQTETRMSWVRTPVLYVCDFAFTRSVSQYHKLYFKF